MNLNPLLYFSMLKIYTRMRRFVQDSNCAHLHNEPSLKVDLVEETSHRVILNFDGIMVKCIQPVIMSRKGKRLGFLVGLVKWIGGCFTLKIMICCLKP